MLLNVLATGRTAGISVVMTADRRTAIRANVAAHMSQRVILQGATNDDLISFGVPARTADRVRLFPGRGFTVDARLVQLGAARARGQPALVAPEDATNGYQAP